MNDILYLKMFERLLKRANNADMSLVNEPDILEFYRDDGIMFVHILIMHLTFDEMFLILQHPLCKIAKSKKTGDYPIHVAAYLDNPMIVNMEDASTLRDNYGRTALHILANFGFVDVTMHKDFNIVIDNDGRTPKDYLDSIVKF